MYVATSRGISLIIQREDDAESDSDSEVVSESDSQSDDQAEDVSSDENDEVTIVKPYAALMQSLAADSAPPAKRRKLETTSVVTNNVEDDLSNDDGADSVDEEEEGPATALEGHLDQDDDDEEIDNNDPFETHFAEPDSIILGQRLKALQRKAYLTERSNIAKVGKAMTCMPDDGQIVPSLPASASGPRQLKIKQKLAGAFEKQRPAFDALERAMAPAIFSYRDVMYCQRTHNNAESLRRLTCTHAVNHIYKTRDRVIKNNSRLAKEEGNVDLDIRDQGFTRPKVLMILPTRQSCVRVINMIVSIVEPEQQENRKRFDDSYGPQDEDRFSEDKAEDFRELFSGNDDDNFRLGLKFTRKTVKYFSQFYNSDIILASPLGLKLAIGSEEERKVDYDFLSSIEVVVVDQADALLMQNWEHVESIFEHLNLQPKEAHGCDFSRVRSWYLDNNAKYFRQTIALAAFNTPEMNTLFFNQSKNWAGKIKITANYGGALQELGFKVKQTFSRLETATITDEPDARFAYFTSAIIPSLTKHSKDSAGTLIFIPSYLDFVKIRNYLSTNTSVTFGNISEYTGANDPKEVARARSHFLTGRHNILLYTERAHHFFRTRIRGVRKIVMYGLPDSPTFYKEIVGGYLARSMQEGRIEPGEGSVRVIFSKWDVMKLERIAGTERVGKMIKEKGDTFDFL